MKTQALTLFKLQILICASQYIHDEDTNLLFPDWQVFYSPLDMPISRYLTTINNCTCRECPGKRTVCFGENCTAFPAGIVVSLPFFKLQLSSVEIIRKGDFRNLSNLTALEIEGNLRLREIEEGVFVNMTQLKNLTILSNGQLKFLHEKVFEGLVCLEILCVSKNGFVQIGDITRACSPLYVPNIKVLSIEEHSFYELHFNDFYPMNGSRLDQLNIILCQIEILHPESLKPLKYLTQLRLVQNLFNRTILTTFIKRTLELGINLDRLNLYQAGLRKTSPYILLEALSNSNLSYLILAGNTYNTIDNNWFPYMPKLLNLDIRFCSIFEISDGAFKPLPNLQRLLLKGNKITTIPYALTVPKGLYFLDISSNPKDEQAVSFFSMPPNLFKNNMTNLTLLNICYNNIGSLTKSTFNGLTTIVKLTIKNCSLSYIESGTFSDMKNLSHLELTNNPLLALMPLTADTFLGLNNLNVLLLGGCALQNLTNTISLFTHVGNLTHLGLDNNNIHNILPNQLIHLNNLNELTLSDNKLPSWNRRILPSSNLSVLDLSQNKFINITVTMMEDWKSVQNLYLQDNPFWCDCTLHSAATWLKQNKLQLILQPAEDLVAQCVAPDTWRGKSIVTFINYLNTNTKECERIFILSEVIPGSILLILIVICVLLSYWYRWHIKYWLFLWRLSIARHYPWKIQKEMKQRSEFKYDAFVLYSVEDATWVSQLLGALEPACRLCVFQRDFVAGEPVAEAALHALLTSRRTLLVLSEAFTRSRWCRWEAQLAHCHQLLCSGAADSLILVRLQPVRRASPLLLYLMNTRIYLDWPQQADPVKQQEFWNKLKVALAAPTEPNTSI